MTVERTREGNRWVAAWPDLLAFAGGLAVAWFAGWNTTDLVWSLWLASLVVGYAMIGWMIFSRASTPALLLGGLFLLAFFTFHFGLFHLVHSVFLNVFFQVTPGRENFIGMELYCEVVRRYWIFLPAAVLAERRHFRRPAPTTDASQALKVFTDQEGGGIFAPYRNVVRLHLLIFFFAAAHFAKLDHFLVYAVVYAVYFFPWRLVRKGQAQGESLGGGADRRDDSPYR